MRKLRYSLLVLLSFTIVSGNTFAQKTVDKIETAAEVVNALGSMFKKKKKDSVATATAAKPGSQPVGNNKTDISIAGKITPQTKMIDCSRLYPFNNGAALVQKGSSYALIDSAGNFVVPYNKYVTIGNAGAGLFSAINDNSSVILNSSGQMVADLKGLYAKGYYTTTESRFVFIYPNSNRHAITLIDANGKSYSITEDAVGGGKFLSFTSISGDVIFMTDPVTKLVGFKNLKNQMIAPVKFENIYAFIDSFAVFSTRNEFKEMRYGIIDCNGKRSSVVFTSSPLNLGGGYFKVSGSDDADFFYAIIDAKGNIIFKESKRSQANYQFQSYEDGYFFGNGYIMDVKGVIEKETTFLTKAGLKSFQSNSYNFAAFIRPKDEGVLGLSVVERAQSDGFLVFSYWNSNSTTAYAYYNVKTKQLIQGDFSTSYTNGYNYSFDPISKRALVIKNTYKKDASGNSIDIEGYVNKEGNFSIVRAEKKSEW